MLLAFLLSETPALFEVCDLLWATAAGFLEVTVADFVCRFAEALMDRLADFEVTVLFLPAPDRLEATEVFLALAFEVEPLALALAVDGWPATPLGT